MDISYRFASEYTSYNNTHTHTATDGFVFKSLPNVCPQCSSMAGRLCVCLHRWGPSAVLLTGQNSTAGEAKKTCQTLISPRSEPVSLNPYHKDERDSRCVYEKDLTNISTESSPETQSKKSCYKREHSVSSLNHRGKFRDKRDARVPETERKPKQGLYVFDEGALVLLTR